MKRILTILAVIIFIATVFAQSPQKMSYQAIIRNSKGMLLTNQKIGMRISILKNQTPVYSETQTVTTNENGLATMEIGNGVVILGTFADIDWPSGAHYIKTETDPNGGTEYSIVGTSELLSVPYALYSTYSGSGPSNVSSDVNVLDDASISRSKTWTSDRINAELRLKANTEALSSVATTGNFNDLKAKPTTLAGYGITDALPLKSTSGDLTTNASGVVTISKNAITSAKIKDGTIKDSDLDKTQIRLSGFGAPISNIVMGGMRITDLAAPSSSSDAANKKYVDDAVSIGGGASTPMLSLDAGQNLSIRGGNSISLSELYQTLSLSGTVLSISGPRASHVDLAGLLVGVSAGSGGGVTHDATLTGNGTSGSLLGISNQSISPLKLTGVSVNGTYGQVLASNGSGGFYWADAASIGEGGSNQLNASNLISGTISTARFGSASIPTSALIGNGNSGTYLRGDGSWGTINIGTDDQVAAEVPIIAINGITSTNVQAALAELQGKITGGGISSVSGSSNLSASTVGGAVTLSLPTTLSGLSSVSSTSFTGALSGNATSATTAATATNIAGGSALDLLYQSGSGTTAKLAKGGANQVLAMDGTASNLVWTTASGGISSVSGSTNLSASTVGGAVTLSLPITLSGLSSVSSTSFTGALSGNATSATTAATATNITGGAAYDLLYQSATGTTSKLTKGGNGQVLAMSGGVLAWVNNASTSDAKADGSTKGVSTFLASDFEDNSSGLISIDYNNAQKASASATGFLTSTDYIKFNATISTGLTRTAGATPMLTANLSTGLSGGQTVIGGINGNENLTLQSNSSITKGLIKFGTSVYSESNNRLGINTSSPGCELDVNGSIYASGSANISGGGLSLGSGGSNVASSILLNDGDASTNAGGVGAVTISAPSSVSANYILTLPAAVATTKGMVLAAAANSSGTLEWASGGGFASATLSSDVVINQNNKNVTFTTGSGRTIMNGDMETKGAVYGNVRKMTVAPTIDADWLVSDYIVIIHIADNQTIYLPNPASYKGRILILRNNSVEAGLSGLYTFSGYSPVDNGSLAAKRGMIIASDGSKWYCVAGQ
jgi:hypothetical protein